jgi:membrane-associated protease RseP (regulator of RpoE activity)
MRKLLATMALLGLIVGVGAAQPGGRAQWVSKEKATASQKGWLGVSIQDITSHLKRSMDLKTTEGALVTSVVDDSPADSAGIKEDDVVVQFGGKDIGESSDLQEAVGKTKPGVKVSITILRKGEKKTLQVTIGKYPRSVRVSIATPRSPQALEIIGEGHRMQGLTLRTLSDQLAQYFQVPDGEGVLVWEVEKDSPAEKAGIKAGDVLTKVGGKRIKEVRDVSRALGAFDEGEKVNVDVIRKGERKSLSIEVAEAEDFHGFNFRFDGSRFNRNLREFYFKGVPDIDIEVPRIEIEHIRPDMDALRIEMDHLRDQLRDQTSRMREDLRRNIRPTVIVRGIRQI